MRIGVFLLAVLWATGASASSVCLKELCVQVDTAQTREELRRGLQGRDVLGEMQGLLFIFDRDDIHKFWMKDMKFPIDILWIDAQGQIVQIAHSCEPCQKVPCAVYVPSQKARYVLELPAGFSLKHQWVRGTQLEFRGIS